MDEQELRALVRGAIARHLGPAAPLGAPPPPVPAAAAPVGSIAVARFQIARAPGEVDCVIEPSVTCTHCAHCLCYGH